MRTIRVYQAIAQFHEAMRGCERAPQITPWESVHCERIESTVRNFLPSGSGFDSGTAFDFDASRADKLVFIAPFHHMNSGGFYDGWTQHSVTIRPAFDGFYISVSGRNKRDIKDYIAEIFDGALKEDFIGANAVAIMNLRPDEVK